MSEIGIGVLALWNDCVAGCEQQYEDWYQTEHLPERLAIPGFIRGRRYTAIDAEPAFFTWYEVSQPDILRSAEYLARLADPTPRTQAIMATGFTRVSRTACRRVPVCGVAQGSVAVTVTLSAADVHFTVEQMREVALQFQEPVTLARAEIWLSDEAPQPQPNLTAEESIRGADAKITACLLLEYLREGPASQAASRLQEFFPTADIGVYRLLCELNAR